MTTAAIQEISEREAPTRESPSTAVATIPQRVVMLRPIAPPDEVISAQEATRDLIARALQKGRDYGLIKGTQKETLFKAGAERVVLAFGCYARFRIIEREVDHHVEIRYSKTKRIYNNAFKGDRSFEEKLAEGISYGLYRYVVECEIIHRETGQIVGAFAGSCSTMESKYIDRPRDCENTIIKMAEKRALVGATLTTFGLSDQFTQDTEDMPEDVRDRSANESSDVVAKDDPSSDWLIPFGDHKGKSVRQTTPEGAYLVGDSELTSLSKWCVKKRDAESTEQGKKKFQSWLDGFETEIERRTVERAQSSTEQTDQSQPAAAAVKPIGDANFKSRYETLFPTGVLKGAKLDEAKNGDYIVPLQALQDIQRWIADRLTATSGALVVKPDQRPKFEQLAVDVGCEIVRRSAVPPRKIEDTAAAESEAPPAPHHASASEIDHDDLVPIGHGENR